jgi:chitinase
VSITNPVNGTVFAAPADVQIQASAAAGGDTVTNVAFLGNGASLGSDQTAPFSMTTGSLQAGAYALSAVATAAGISTTSAVVNITVVSPVDVTITSPQITNNVFSFDYTANSGLRYVVQNSSNLTDWLSVITNVASGSPVHYADPSPPDNSRYFRVGRLPNP